VAKSRRPEFRLAAGIPYQVSDYKRGHAAERPAFREADTSEALRELAGKGQRSFSQQPRTRKSFMLSSVGID
jgi:hypothetical protein